MRAVLGLQAMLGVPEAAPGAAADRVCGTIRTTNISRTSTMNGHAAVVTGKHTSAVVSACVNRLIRKYVVFSRIVLVTVNIPILVFF